MAIAPLLVRPAQPITLVARVPFRLMYPWHPRTAAALLLPAAGSPSELCPCHHNRKRSRSEQSDLAEKHTALSRLLFSISSDRSDPTAFA